MEKACNFMSEQYKSAPWQILDIERVKLCKFIWKLLEMEQLSDIYMLSDVCYANTKIQKMKLKWKNGYICGEQNLSEVSLWQKVQAHKLLI